MAQADKIINKLNAEVKRIKGVAIRIAAIEGEKSVRRNFDEGGRPKWVPRKRISKKQRGTNILVISGKMKNVTKRVEENQSRAVLRTNPQASEYAKIQHEGGKIYMQGRTYKFRVKYKKGNKRTVFASSRHKRISKTTKGGPYVIRIPARPYMNIPESDFPGILSIIKSAVKI